MPIDTEDRLCDRFEQAVARMADDPHLVWRGRTLTAAVAVEIGGTRLRLTLREGRVERCDRQAPPLAGARFTVRAGPAAWAAFWQPVPAPGWHDLFALTKRGAMTIDGDTRALMAHLQYVKDLLALPRAGGGAGAESRAEAGAGGVP